MSGATPSPVVLTFAAVEPARLGAAFVALLTRDLTTEELAKVRVQNLAVGEGVCASHDFCDANMVMVEALRALTGEPDAFPHSPDDVALWNEAWEIAKRDHLTERATLDDLTTQWEEYCAREGLAHECALETLMFADLTPEQRTFITAFNARWDALQDAADLAATVQAHGA